MLLEGTLSFFLEGWNDGGCDEPRKEEVGVLAYTDCDWVGVKEDFGNVLEDL